jgi:hypothetical protein
LVSNGERNSAPESKPHLSSFFFGVTAVIALLSYPFLFLQPEHVPQLPLPRSPSSFLAHVVLCQIQRTKTKRMPIAARCGSEGKTDRGSATSAGSQAGQWTAGREARGRGRAQIHCTCSCGGA